MMKMRMINKVLITLFVLSLLSILATWYSLGTRRFSSSTFTLSKCDSEKIEVENVDPNIPIAFLHSVPFSKDLVVHSAYFDDRPRNGHNNLTIFFIDINKTIFDLKLVTGCGVGNRKADDFLLRYVAEDILMHIWLGPRPFLYENAVVECYDLPVINGSRGFVIYKRENDSVDSIITESENPVMIPAPRIEPTGDYNFTVLTCTKAHNRNVTWLPEFVRYQKTIGVDHVHISVLDTFIKDGGMQYFMMNEPAMHQDVNNGYLTFSVWKEWYSDRDEEKEVYLHSEILRKSDCLYHFRGTYDYAFSLDTDDFFNPRIPGKTNVKEYILRYCYEKPAGSCAFQWLYLFPDICGGIKGEIGEDGNVTDHLVSKKLTNYNGHFKSVHKTQALVDATFHDAKMDGCLLPGYKAVVVPSNVAYMAHVRMHTSKKMILADLHLRNFRKLC